MVRDPSSQKDLISLQPITLSRYYLTPIYKILT